MRIGRKIEVGESGPVLCPSILSFAYKSGEQTGMHVSTRLNTASLSKDAGPGEPEALGHREAGLLFNARLTLEQLGDEGHQPPT